MEMLLQDENAYTIGPVSGTLDVYQRLSAKPGSGQSPPLGKAAMSAKTPGRKAFHNITNQPDRHLKKKASAASKKPRRAFGDITNVATAPHDSQQVSLPETQHKTAQVTATVGLEKGSQPGNAGKIEHLAGKAWLQQEQERLAARHSFLTEEGPTSVVARYYARRLPAEDLSLMAWKAQQDSLGHANYEEVPYCSYSEPPSADTWPQECGVGIASSHTLLDLPDVDCSVLCA